jgi:hypothetical protein
MQISLGENLFQKGQTMFITQILMLKKTRSEVQWAQSILTQE